MLISENTQLLAWREKKKLNSVCSGGAKVKLPVKEILHSNAWGTELPAAVSQIEGKKKSQSKKKKKSHQKNQPTQKQKKKKEQESQNSLFRSTVSFVLSAGMEALSEMLSDVTSFLNSPDTSVMIKML